MKLKRIVKVGTSVIFSMALTNRAIAVTDKRQWGYLYFTRSSYYLNKLWDNNDLHDLRAVPKGHSFLLQTRKRESDIWAAQGQLCSLSYS